MQFKDLNFSYNDLQIFKDFNFECHSSIVLIMGPSGCGKTTLLKIMARVLTNNLTWNIFDAPNLSYLVLQDDALCPWLTGLDNITKFSNIDIEILKKMPLYKHSVSFIERKTFKLSFGQRRMIELLRAFTLKPKLLLLDEPFNYIDEESKKIVSEELLYLIEENNTNAILSSHHSEKIGFKAPEIFYFPQKKPISSLVNEKLY